MVVNNFAKIGSCIENIANIKWCVEIVGKSVSVLKISSISPVESTALVDTLPSLTPYSKYPALIDKYFGRTLLTTLFKKHALKGLF